VNSTDHELQVLKKIICTKHVRFFPIIV
jgi:hypothetical protein